MILRVVGLPVRSESETQLLNAFHAAYPRIRALPGCHYLALLRSREPDPGYLTVSLWTSAQALDAYRKSPLFAEIWPQIRATLGAEPWAESFEFAAGDPAWLPDEAPDG